MGTKASNLVLHIPHSSKEIPDDVKEQFILSDKDLNHELLLMTDAYTDDLFVQDDPEIKSIIFPVSRLVVDPEEKFLRIILHCARNQF